MLKIKGHRCAFYGPNYFVTPEFRILDIERNFKIKRVGRAYLRSIIEAPKPEEYEYKGWWYLGFALKMCDKMQGAAMSVNAKVDFGHEESVRLDSAYWRKHGSGGNASFSSKTKKYAIAVDGALADSAKNGLECKALTHLMALRGLQLAVGDKRFDELLNNRLGARRLKIPLNRKLLQSEVLDTQHEFYHGSRVFRPGDLVAFGNTRTSLLPEDWIWRVENAICVGWEFDAKGVPVYESPLFVGGGVATVMTEAKMKEFLYNKTPDRNPDGTLKLLGGTSAEERRRHYAERALGGPTCTHPSLRNLALHTSVQRISVLGGRNDLT